MCHTQASNEQLWAVLREHERVKEGQIHGVRVADCSLSLVKVNGARYSSDGAACGHEVTHQATVEIDWTVLQYKSCTRLFPEDLQIWFGRNIRDLVNI